MRHDNRWALALANHLSHRIGFTRTRHAKQQLLIHISIDTLNELFNRLRLIACRLKVGDHLKGAARYLRP